MKPMLSWWRIIDIMEQWLVIYFRWVLYMKEKLLVL